MDQKLRERALSNPTHVAIECDQVRWTYRQLDERTNALAAALLARGCRQDARIGLVMPHGPEMVAAMLATLRATATYVPIDPSWPSERARALLADLEPAIVVADSSIRAYAESLHRRLLIWDFQATERTAVKTRQDPDA